MKEIDKKLSAVDSMDLTKENIIFAGRVETPDLFYLKINDQKNMLRIFVENSTINVSLNPDSVDKAEILGSLTHDVYKQFAKEINEFELKQRALYSDYQMIKATNNETGAKLIEKQLEENYDKQQAYAKSFVDTNPESIVSMYIVRWYLVYGIGFDELNAILEKVPTNLTTTTIYNTLVERLEILEKTKIGKHAIEFSMETPNGELISLNDFKGKYLLIDFWASWCVPCRKANPFVIEMYKKYNKLGFEVLGISFDSNKERWIEAIKADKLEWKHVSDLKGWQNAVGQLYGINSIPHTILLDKEGVIIGNRLSNEELELKLKEIFKQ